jgi:hypothetical protein
MASAIYKWRIARASVIINTCNACSARETIAICMLLTQDLLCSVKEPQLIILISLNTVSALV